MNDALAVAYRARLSEKINFGDNWCGPEGFTHGVEALVATYAREGEEGRAVEVMCSALPARFYKIRVSPGADGSPGYEISTGSGMDRWTAETALAIATGMADFKPS